MKRTLKTINICVGTLGFILIVFSGAFAQSSLNTLGGNTNDAGGSVSFSLGQVFYRTTSGATGSLTEGIQHPFELFGSSVPATYTLGNRVIGAGDLLCFDARQSITVAGGEGAVVIQPNGVVDFIAGQSIRFLPGFHAEAGSYVDAQITSDGIFCNSLAESTVVLWRPDEKSEEFSFQDEEQTQELKPGFDAVLYPNPNSGRFSVGLINTDQKVKVSICNLTGTIFYHSEMENGKQEFSLPFLRKGLYIVRLICGNEQIIKKMIVN